MLMYIPKFRTRPLQLPPKSDKSEPVPAKPPIRGTTAAKPTALLTALVDRAVTPWNVNARTPIEVYKQTNNRNFSAVESHFGSFFSKLFPADSLLDIGSGYGLAGVEALKFGKVKRATAIDAKNALGPLRRRDIAWFRKNEGDYGTAKIMAPFENGLVQSVMHESFDERPPSFKADAIETLVAGGSARLAELEAGKHPKFKFQVGMAEAVLPKLKERFSVAIDPFGAYFYSADRAKLLRHTYEKLDEGGTGLTIIRGRDVHLKVDPQTSTLGRTVNEYGPETTVHRRDGRVQKFQDYLIETYPTVFSVRQAHQDTRVSNGPQHDILVMRRDPLIPSLQKLKRLTVGAPTYGADGMEAQMPNVILTER